LEGIPGLTSVGSIDPSLSLLLCEDGMSVDQALQVLTLQSGFQALDPQLMRLDTLIQNTMPKEHQISRERLQNHLLKQIGSGMAGLNGAQQLLFLTTSLEPSHHFLLDLAKRLTSLGADCMETPLLLDNGLLQITTSNSKIKIHALEIYPWVVLAQTARA
jgi:acetate kinase